MLHRVRRARQSRLNPVELAQHNETAAHRAPSDDGAVGLSPRVPFPDSVVAVGAGARRQIRRLRTRILPGMRHLSGTRLRACRCCERASLFVSFSAGDEFKFCVRCRANLRYEQLAAWIRENEQELGTKTVVELDTSSPLRAVLRRAGTYIRTYYSATDERGSIREDGTRCEDIQQLAFPSSSIDIIVSSDVLEHVPDLEAAMRETRRVLRPGGYHLFTVPTQRVTRRRAREVDGAIEYLSPPRFHSDRLSETGRILTYWDIGTVDGGEQLSLPGLAVGIVAGPEGSDDRVVWRALRLPDASGG
jgi:SAM-dependent methyltransferase